LITLATYNDIINVVVTMEPRNIYIAIAPGTYNKFTVKAEAMNDYG